MSGSTPTQAAFMVDDTITIYAGMDEVGRGSLAGPVVAAACVLTTELFKRRSSIPRWSPFKRAPESGDCLIGDSKQLSPKERDHTFEWLIQHATYGVGSVSAAEIDRIGIKGATYKAMVLALAELREKTSITGVLVDGNDKFQFDCPSQCIIRGDQTEPSIAAASIIAKVTRDRYMCEQHELFPMYLLSGHKGYGSSDHISAIKQYGPCELHRRSFLRNIMSAETSLHQTSFSDASSITQLSNRQ